MSPTVPRPPLWLNNALGSESYIRTVFGVLSDREIQRSSARDLSQRRTLQQSDSNGQGRKKRDITSSQIEHYAITAALCPRHLELNRYFNITPYDRTRVVVYDGCLGVESQLQGRYLNASWVLERKGGRWWIATQAPLKRSAHTFLVALTQPITNPPASPSESRVRTVVQLTRDSEHGRRKADPYFPSEVGKTIIISPDDDVSGPPFKITLCGTRTIEEAECIESTVSIVPVVTTNSSGGADSIVEDQTVTFKHLLYLSWPDQGVPEDHRSLLSFIRIVDETNRDGRTNENSDPPIIVGCSAGVGRTGTFIALASLLRGNGLLLPALRPSSASVLPPSPLGPLPELLKVDEVALEIDSLREQRPRMVERPEQVVLIYKALSEAFN